MAPSGLGRVVKYEVPQAFRPAHGCRGSPEGLGYIEIVPFSFSAYSAGSVLIVVSCDVFNPQN